MPGADQHHTELKAYLADRDVPCPGCGYNLRGVTEPACPECGDSLDTYAVLAGPAKPRLRFVFYAIDVVGLGFAGLLLLFAFSTWPGYVYLALAAWFVVLPASGALILHRNLRSSEEFGVIFWMPHALLAALHFVPICMFIVLVIL